MLKKLNDWMLETYVAKMEKARQNFQLHLKNERGAGATEYALVITVVVGLVVIAAYALKEPLEGFFAEIGGWLSNFLGSKQM